ncbi:MAG: YqiA/YcfP family alpha/beta fold hydrolase [Kofleriaceae bacterium]
MEVFYLPGFASGPSSTKAQAFAAHLASRGVTVECLDLRKPSFEHLRLSAMIDHVRASLRGDTILIGSSLGGLTAARVAERDERVKALVLLAPAFRLVHRWQEQLGTEWDDWKRTGWREVFDYSKNGPSKISFGFIDDALALGTDLPNVMARSLVIHGTRDEIVPIEYSRELAQLHPDNVTLIEVDDGHQLLGSIPRLLAESDRFLAPLLE